MHSKIVKQLFKFETFPSIESPGVGARMCGSNLVNISILNSSRKKWNNVSKGQIWDHMKVQPLY